MRSEGNQGWSLKQNMNTVTFLFLCQVFHQVLGANRLVLKSHFLLYYFPESRYFELLYCSTLATNWLEKMILKTNSNAYGIAGVSKQEWYFINKYISVCAHFSKVCAHALKLWIPKLCCLYSLHARTCRFQSS